jgi:hypothetical protein
MDGIVYHKFLRADEVKNRVTLCNDTNKISHPLWMTNKDNNILRVSTKLKGSKESSYFVISSKDRLHRIDSYKQVFFGCRSAFPVLKSCRNLRRTDDDDDKDIDDNKEFDIKRKMTPTTPIDGTPMPGSTNPTVVSNLPSTLQENNNGSTLSTTAEEDDDVTVQTSNSNPTKQQGWISYNIKLLLTNKHGTSDSALQHAMLTILETIDRANGGRRQNFRWSPTASKRFPSPTTFNISSQIPCQLQSSSPEIQPFCHSLGFVYGADMSNPERYSDSSNTYPGIK